MVFLLAVVYAGKEGPKHGGGIAFGRTQKAASRQHHQLFLRIVRADAGGFVGKHRPQRKKLVVPADEFGVAKAVGPGGHLLVFVAGQRPALPAAQGLAPAQMNHRVKVVVGHDIAFPALAVERKKNETNFITEQTIF